MSKKTVFAYFRVATKEQLSGCPENGTSVRLQSKLAKQIRGMNRSKLTRTKEEKT